MNTLRHHFRPAVWLALIAIAAMALLPTLSHALARSGGAGSTAFTEVCTPQGMKVVALTDGEEAPDSAQLRLEHCHWCTAAIGDLAPPPVILPQEVPAAAGVCVPTLFLQARHTLHAWASVQPRAPPALS